MCVNVYPFEKGLTQLSFSKRSTLFVVGQRHEPALRRSCPGAPWRIGVSHHPRYTWNSWCAGLWEYPVAEYSSLWHSVSCSDVWLKIKGKLCGMLRTAAGSLKSRATSFPFMGRKQLQARGIFLSISNVFTKLSIQRYAELVQDAFEAVCWLSTRWLHLLLDQSVPTVFL